MYDPMQYLRRMRKRSSRLFTRHIPWALPLSPHEVSLKYGGVMSCNEIMGPDQDSRTDDAVARHHADVNRVLMSLKNGYTLNFEVQCDPMAKYPGSDVAPRDRWTLWPDRASYLLDEESRHIFESGKAYVDIRSYMSVSYRFPAETTSWLQNLMYSRGRYERGRRVNYIRHMSEYRRSMHMFRTQLSRVVKVRALEDKELREYLHSTVSTSRRRLGDSDVRGMLDRRLAVQALDGDMELTLGGKPIRILEVTEWSKKSFPAMFANLNRLGRRYRFCIRYACKDQQTSERIVMAAASGWGHLRKNFFAVAVRMFQGIPGDAPGSDNKQAVSMEEQAEKAAALVRAGEFSYGNMTLAVVLYGEAHDGMTAEEDLDDQEARVNSVLFGSQTLFKSADINAFDAFLGTIPGHIFANACWAPVSTANLAHAMPATSVWTGDEWNDWLEGPALLHVTTEGNMPFRLNIHVQSVGHTFLGGRTGSGKTTVLNRIRAAWRRYKSRITGRHGRVITFEVGRGAVPITRALGGKTVDLGMKGSIGLQPYRRIDEDVWRVRMHEWTLDLLSSSGITITPVIENDVTKAMALLAKNEPKNRTMTLMQTYLDDPACQLALAKFTDDHGQPYGYLFDNDHERFDLEDVITFEMGSLFENRAICVPTLTYLFWVIEDSMGDGTDTLLVIDEGWKFLTDTLFATKIDDWLRTMRKKRCSVIFATQNLRDIIDNKTASPTLLNEDNFPTKILLANETASSNKTQAAFYEKMGCNERQIQIVADLEPAQEAYFFNARGARRFSVHLGAVGLALCGKSGPDDLLLSDRLWALAATMPHDPGYYLRNWMHSYLPEDWAEKAVGPLDLDGVIKATLAAE